MCNIVRNIYGLFGVKKIVIRNCLVGVCLIGLIACSGNKEPHAIPVPKIDNMVNTNITWDMDGLSKSLAGSFVPVLDNNAIFTADSQGHVFRLDDTDGTVINKFNLKRKLSSGVAVSPDSIFVTTTDAHLLSISRVTGEINWQAALPTISIEAPQIGGDIIVVKTNDSQLSAYDVKTGALLWVNQKSSPPLTLRAYNSFQVVGREVVIQGQPGGKLALINLTNGVAMWENYIAIPKGSTDLDKLTDVAMRPSLKDKSICVATYNGKISCLDAISSNIAWAKNFSSSSGVLIGEQNVYSVNVDGVVYAFDKITGAKVWSNDILQYRNLGVPAFLGNNILLIDNDGHINLFRRTDGRLVARVSSDLKDGTSYPIFDNNKVIIQSGNGHIAKITE